jgi:serine/threonine protein kinase
MEQLHQSGDIIIQRYRFIAPLGRGGMGTTYEAEDLTNHQKVAIKALSLHQATEWKILELFEREARVLANLSHPGIPKYLNYFYIDTPSDRRFYLVQELIEGESLAELVNKGWRINEDKVKQIAKDVLEIIKYLQTLNPPVIHRDIKPQNILYCPDGRIFLVDFGAVRDVYRNTLTRGSTFVGTLDYMPPEQLRGQAFFASDLYSLGATLLFLLTHRSPADLPQKRMKIDFRSRIPLSRQFGDWLEKMLEPAVEDRFKSACEALQELNGKISTSSVALKNRQPAGSRIVMKRSTKQLAIDIPSPGLRWETLGFTFFTLCWNAIVLPMFFEWMIGKFPSFFFLFILPHTVIGLGSIAILLFIFAGRTFLKIDRQTFQIQWECCGCSVQIRGRTENISRIEVSSSNIRINNRPVIHCVIWEGVRQRRFGSWLTPVEKDWLIAELKDFLDQIQQ